MAVDFHHVNAIYQRYLGRDAEPQALEYWSMSSSLLDVERGVWGSDEFKGNTEYFHAPSMNVNWKVCFLAEAKIVFVPIPKNAHTSLLDAFLKLKGVDWRNLQINDELVLKHGDSDIKVHYALQENQTGLLLKDYSPAYIDDALCSDDWIRVAVIRDPVDRFISTFNHLFLQERDNPMWHRHIRAMFPEWGKGDLEQCSDETALRRVIKHIAGHGSSVEVHFRRQCEYLSDFKIDCLIPIERLAVLKQLVFARCGRGLDIPSMNVRGGATDGILTFKERAILEDHYWIDKMLYTNASKNVDEMVKMYIS